MKARLKATGRIIEVSQGIYSSYLYVDNNGTIYKEEHLEILQEELASTIDYWTRIEHQAAIAAMQGFLASGIENTYEKIAEFSINQAHALVEKMKNTNE